MSMSKALRQMPAESAGRVAEAHGEAGRDAASDEAGGPRQDTKDTGSALLKAALTKENMHRALKRVRANKGAAGIDGLDIIQTVDHLRSQWPSIRAQLLQGTYRPYKGRFFHPLGTKPELARRSPTLGNTGHASGRAGLTGIN